VGAGIFRTKSVEQSIAETDEPGHRLKKELTTLDLMVFGIGVIVGTGIFVLTGRQAAVNAGPAVVLSFLLAAVVLLRDPGRVRRLGHRLGSRAGTGPGRRSGVPRLVGIPAHAAEPARLAGR
jgi:hypothetical protein